MMMSNIYPWASLAKLLFLMTLLPALLLAPDFLVPLLPDYAIQKVELASVPTMSTDASTLHMTYATILLCACTAMHSALP